MSERTNAEMLEAWSDDQWFHVLVQLNAILMQIVPEYEIAQIKEKFGGLRFYTYWSTLDEEKIRAADYAVRLAEMAVDGMEKQDFAKSD